MFILFTNILIKDKLSRNVIGLYLIWWATWLLISTFNPFELYDVSINIYLLLLLNVSTFLMGYLSVLGKRQHEVLNGSPLIDIKSMVKLYDRMVLSNKFFKLILVILFFILAYYFILYQKSVDLYGIGQARYLRFRVGGLFKLGIEIIIYNYVISTAIYLCISIISFSVLLGKIKSFIFLVSSLNLLLYAGIGAGRFILVMCAFSIIFAKLVSKVCAYKDYSGTMQQKKALKTGIIVGILIFLVILYCIYLTGYRMGIQEISIDAALSATKRFFNSVVLYCIGSFRALDYAFKSGILGEEYFFGRATLAGIDEFLTLSLNTFGIDISTAITRIDSQIQEFFLVGNGQLFNALFTNVFWFYKDFGILGVVFIPFLHGRLLRLFLRKFRVLPTLPTFIICVLIFNAAMMSSLSWYFQTISSELALIIAYFWYKKNKNNIKGKRAAKEDLTK